MITPRGWVKNANRLTKRQLLPWVFMFVVIISSVAQETVPSTTIDWAVRTTGQQACVQSGANPTIAKLRLLNPNVILYSYTLDVRSYPIAGDDGKFLLDLANVSKGLESQVACDEFDSAVDHIWSSHLFPKSRESVPLENTRSDLARLKRDIDLVNQGIPSGCSPRDPVAARTELEYLPIYLKAASNLDRAGSAEVDFSYSVDNKHWNQFHVQERTRFSNMETGAALTWKCGLDDVLTLSVGTLLTALPYRTYDHQSVPTASGVQDQLVVNGTGPVTPIGVALLNYRLWNLDRDPQLGLAISTGPAFKLGGNVHVSAIGWFGGASVSLWRRLFISPGIHVGQFADFPRGFQNGSVIPPNFGNLTPITRWSTRFSIALTFQTNSFVKSDKSTPTTMGSQQKPQPSKNAN